MTYSRKKKEINEEWLRQKYSHDGATVDELAKEVGCSTHTIKKWLKLFGIKRLEKPAYRAWNKGLTKETDERVAQIASSHICEKNPMFGKDSWNKGLTAQTDERLAKISEKRKGCFVSEETREKQRQAKLGLRGEETNHWKGAKPVEAVNGYIVASKRYVHRVIAEINLGRKLMRAEHVHHLDGNPKNNSETNLIVLSQSSHNRLHKAIQRGDTSFDCPEGQKKWLELNSFSYEEVVNANNRIQRA